jgi:PAS domain S-box-containing protein
MFWNASRKILLYQEKDNLGVNSFLEKSKLAGLLILLGVLMPIFPIIIIVLANLRTSKTNQKKLKSILDNTFDSIIMIDNKGIITTANKSTLETFGYKEKELIGKNVNILVPQPYHDHHDGYIKSYNNDKSTSSKIIGADRELFGLHKNGTQVAISLAVTQCKLEDEQFFIGSIRDISEQKRLKENEKAQEHMLMQQSKLASMGEMVTAIAHQWRQPLNAIGLSIQDMVSAQKHGELDKEYVIEIKDDITEQLKFMSDTIDEFRNFFKQSNENVDFNLIDILIEVHKLLWTQLSSNSLTLNLHVKVNNEIINATELVGTQKNNFKIFNKPSELKQILINLVVNAKDALLSSETNNNVKKEIIVEVERIKNKVEIRIKDFAGGIDNKIVDRIFEPYFTTKKMGTGLGLYICQMLAQKSLKSHITAGKHEIKKDGKTFKGSIFSLSLDIKA